MTYFEAILYGFVQGFTEFLPVSSSGHLVILPYFLKHTDPGLTFDVFLHLGTLLAILIYFRRDWIAILGHFFGRTQNPDVNWKAIAVATLPAVIAGVALHSLVSSVFRGTGVVATTLMLGGVVLFLGDRLFPMKRELKDLSLKDALIVGLFQCLALVPGVSRSGSTMVGARFLGFGREAAARFSFLISAPITAGAVIFELKDWQAFSQSMGDMGPVFVAGASSFVFGLIAIDGLLRIVRKFSYLSFAVYRIALALIVLSL